MTMSSWSVSDINVSMASNSPQAASQPVGLMDCSETDDRVLTLEFVLRVLSVRGTLGPVPSLSDRTLWARTVDAASGRLWARGLVTPLRGEEGSERPKRACSSGDVGVGLAARSFVTPRKGSESVWISGAAAHSKRNLKPKRPLYLRLMPFFPSFRSKVAIPLEMVAIVEPWMSI